MLQSHQGDAIVGYVTRGKGIAVHSRACPNVQNLMYDSERKIEVEWQRNTKDTFPVRIIVKTDDRPGLLHQLTTVLANENTNVRSLEARTDFSNDQRRGIVEMTVDVRDKKQLEKLCSAMRRISGVRDVERTTTNKTSRRMTKLPATPNILRSRNRKASKSTGKTATTVPTTTTWLRDWCPCASCTGSHGTEPRKKAARSAAESVSDVRAEASKC